MNKERVAIVAMGNAFRSDDAIGIKVANECQRLLKHKNLLVLNQGNDGIFVLDFIDEIGFLIFVDAADFKAKPGTIKIFDLTDFMEGSFNLISTHTYDIFGFLQGYPDLTVKILGIQPQSFKWGEKLTPEVDGAIPAAVKTIDHIIRKWRAHA